MELWDSEKRREVVSVCLFVAVVLKVESKAIFYGNIYTQREIRIFLDFCESISNYQQRPVIHTTRHTSPYGRSQSNCPPVAFFATVRPRLCILSRGCSDPILPASVPRIHYHYHEQSFIYFS